MPEFDMSPRTARRMGLALGLAVGAILSFSATTAMANDPCVRVVDGACVCWQRSDGHTYCATNDR